MMGEKRGQQRVPVAFFCSKPKKSRQGSETGQQPEKERKKNKLKRDDL